MISEREYLRIGKIVGSHSLQGRLKVYVITDLPERFATGNTVLIGGSGKYEQRVVRDFKFTKKRNALLLLDGVSDRNAADALRGKEIFIEKSVAEERRNYLEKGSFYYYDLIGSSVFLDDREYGRVTDIMDTGAGDILVIENGKGKENLIPFVDEMVKTDHIDRGRIDIFPIEGMLDF